MLDLINETPLSVKAVAKLMDVTPKTVYIWAKGIGVRRLETAKVGGLVYTTREALQRFSVQNETIDSEVFQIRGATGINEAEMLMRQAAAKKALRDRHGI